MKNKKSGKYISIRTRLFLEVGAVIMVAIIFILSMNFFLLPTIYTYNEKQHMKKVCSDLDVLLKDSVDPLSYISSAEKENGFSIDVYQQNGSNIYVGTYDIFSSAGKVIVSDRKDYDDGSFFEIQTNSKSDKKYIVYGTKLSNGWEIEMFSSKEYIDNTVRLAITITNAISVIALLLALIFIYFYTGKFTNPLISMSKVTGKIAKMDFSEKCNFERNDEIGLLSSSINNLSDSLNDALKNLSEKNKKLKEDIEKEKNLERIRKEFISNVSHELKTPISIIRGYSEGVSVMLESEDCEGAKSYCDIIINETDKMNVLVLQLLELSKYESGNIDINKEKFNIYDMINDYALGNEIKFKENLITFENNVKKELFGTGDTIKIEMIINNYISNAVSHAQGEKLISADCVETEDGNYRVKIFNTGENIADEDIDKIWISFYRADKSRSRSEGRFGLGLSIVSAIQKLHKKQYGVYNTSDGVCFWFDIEKA